MNKTAPQSQNNPNWQALAEHGFPRLLFRFARERVSGLLYLTFGEQRVTIVIYQGAPVFANSNALQDSLGKLLISRGVLTRVQLDEAIAITKSSSKQLGAILVQKNLLSAQDLLQYLREQIKAIILKVFSWEGGHYFFENQQLANREMISLVNNPLEIILLGIHQSFSLGRLMQEGVKQDAVFCLKPVSTPLVESLNLGPVAAKILTLVDGKRHVKAIVESSGAEALEALKAFYSLWMIERIEKIASSEPQAKPAKEKPSATSDGPEIIAPEQDARVALEDLPFQDNKDEVLKRTEDFVITAGKSSGSPMPSAKNSAPVILGNVDELEKAYETKKKSPPAAGAAQDFQDETLGEVTLDEVVPAAGKPSSSDPNESTLEPKDFSKAKTAVVEQKPAKGKTSEVKSKPAAAPAPLKSSTTETPKAGVAAETLEPAATVMLATGGWMRFAKYFVFAGVISILVTAILGLYVYLDPESAAKYLDRIRLLKMYGQASLDAKRLGQFYEDDGQLKQAQLAFEKALQQAPKDDRLELTLARVSQRLEEWDKAKKHFETIIARNPALTDAHLGLAWCFLHEGEVVRAKREFYLYLASSPVSPQTESIRRLVHGLQ